MKKVLMMLIVGLSMDVNAQSDGFFRYQYEYREIKNEEWNELILLPNAHGLDYNYPADNVPIGTGLLLLSGMGLAYANYRKSK